MRSYRSFCLIGILALVVPPIGPVASAAEPAKRPNVLFIAVDDLNHWVGHLARNPQTRTPNIDRLAKLGVTFTRAYRAAPVCNPSLRRASCRGSGREAPVCTTTARTGSR